VIKAFVPVIVPFRNLTFLNHMVKLSRLASEMQESEIITLNEAVKVKLQMGEQVFNYTIGDFDPRIFPIPAMLQHQISVAYDDRYTTYPLANGLLELREAVANFVNTKQGLSYSPDEILIAGGGRSIIYSLFQAIVDPGDIVVYAVPSWSNNHYARICQAESRIIATKAENEFLPTAEEIGASLNGASLLCLCSPQNPTGTVMQEMELARICDLVLQENRGRKEGEKKLYVMFDQMYGNLTYGDVRHVDPVSLRTEMKEYTIYVDGISKAFAATGVRVGWSMGPILVLEKMKFLLGHSGGWAPVAEQKATAAFLNDPTALSSYLDDFKSELSERLRLLYDGIKKLGEKGFPVEVIEPRAAIYLSVKLELAGLQSKESKLRAQADVTSYILDKVGMAIIPFYFFGTEETSPWYRLSVGTCRKEDIPVMLSRLEHALSDLQVPAVV